MNSFKIVNGKKLRSGFTTGTAAAAAAAGAVTALLTGEKPKYIELTTPLEIELKLEIIECVLYEDKAVSSVIKDAGDDPDVTHGVKISATTTKIESGIIIDGGDGVGRVTKKGLQYEIASAAINKIPIKMIINSVQKVIDKTDYTGGIKIIISAENGELIAKNTFNSRLGIIGGISILGTTGIVEPMSDSAITETIHLEIDTKIAENGNDKLLLSVGNYGRDFAYNEFRIDLETAVKCSNFIGDSLDYAVYKGVKKILLIGHSGKLVKLAAGVMDTHSKNADARAEVFATHSALNSVGVETIKEIMEATTTDEMDEIISKTGRASQIWNSILEKIKYHLSMRVKDLAEIEAVVFTNRNNSVKYTKNAAKMLKLFKEEIN